MARHVRNSRAWQQNRRRRIEPIAARLVMKLALTRAPYMPVAISGRRITEGRPVPLGATWDGLGVNFALFSAHATRVELCLFDNDGRNEERIDLPEYTDEVWHGYLPECRPGTVYAYRVHGPYEPENGHRFNPNKLLIDPYAKSMIGQVDWAPELFGYTIGDKDADLSFDPRDSAPFMPKCRVIDPAFTWGRDHPPLVPWEQTILYETHVRGYTMRHPAVPEPLRGTYAGLATRPVIDYIKSLGVTSVELLPIHSFLNDDYLLQKNMVNYWGYNTIGFFSPVRRYASNPDFAFAEFKEMVARFHDAGLEVILDVVYNHTAEGNERGATLSFKGIDNASYYRLLPDQERYYINDTGTGNTLNLSHPRVLQMVTDSLRYWVQEMHVDGFRFDLGTILAREPHGFDQGSGFLRACRQDPVLTNVKMIAEPWDCGPGGYQVGGFPPGWAEWNDTFRDTVRDFWRGESDAGRLAPKLCASAAQFDRHGRRPWASVNFLTAHDGFTLNDIVSYNDKHNEANGEENKDGHSDNRSWNCGVEGPTDDAEINTLRERQIRNLMGTLLLSQGTPMILAGDEFGRTQNGNNNAYCQDNEISWLNWDLHDRGEGLIRFVRRLTDMRRRYPILRRMLFMNGQFDEELGVRDVTWINASGREINQDEWDDPTMRCFGMLMDGRARASGVRRRGTETTLLAIFNAHYDVVTFHMPPCAGGDTWSLRIDTNRPDEDYTDQCREGDAYMVTGRSLLLLQLELAETPPGPGKKEEGSFLKKRTKKLL
jgi:glycogen operon protein